MTFIMKADGSCMAQVTSVESPFGGIVNSEVLCPSNGFRKSSLMVILLGPAVMGGAAESLLHRRIDPSHLSLGSRLLRRWVGCRLRFA
jgi:hypothetical protein